MADAPNAEPPRRNIIQDIVDVGRKAFDPTSDQATQDAEKAKYDDLVNKVDTWTLLHALNALVKSDAIPPWLRAQLMQTLTLLPLRHDGVRGTLELVFSVHPSNAGRLDPSGGREPQKQGASITHEAVAVATKLLSTVPASMTAEDWFRGISDQLFALMDETAGPDLARTAAQIVGYGILGKKIYGAPGSAGWNVFAQPLLEGVNPSLAQTSAKTKEEANDEVVDLSRAKVLVAADKLRQSVHRLQMLVISNPSPGLCRRILGRVILQIWALASWNNPDAAMLHSINEPARKLLKIYLQLFGKWESIKPLIDNLTYKGSTPASSSAVSPPWRFTRTSLGTVEITAWTPPDASLPPEFDWMDIEYRAATLSEYIANTCSAEDTSSIFLSLLHRWVERSAKQGGKEGIELIAPVEEEAESPVEDLMEFSVLHQLMEKAPEKLISHFDQLLQLISQVFEADAQSPLSDEVIGLVLSLLNLAVTAPTFQKSDICEKDLRTVEISLARLAQDKNRTDVSTTARNLGLLLKYRDELDDDTEDKGKRTLDAGKMEDRKTYDLAMSYITGDKENPPPIVAEGLTLLSGLITAESPMLDVTAVVVLLAKLLEENEDYINLQVIKMFTQLASKHPKTTMRELLDHYLDAREKSTTDTRLRFGEALVQVIERLGQTFAGEMAQKTGETLVSIAGRRGYRPKTLARQAKAERLRQLKGKKRAQLQGEGVAGAMHEKEGKGEKKDYAEEEEEVEEEEEEEDQEDEEEKAKNDALAQIIQGWESKRGSEDIRMRTSALSILGGALESNIAGLGASIASISVEVCLSVLTLEPEMEKGILRRAAVLTVLSFVRGLAGEGSGSRRSGSLGFGLGEESRREVTRTLEYVAATDNDGLVREHARDVVESLANWRMTSLVGETTAATPVNGMMGAAAGTAGLAQLVGPWKKSAAGGATRARIEEIE